jgi:hypothetical protein
MIESDPELILLKWAFKLGLLDEDELSTFHVRYRREKPGVGYLRAALDWRVLDETDLARLLDPAEIAAGEANGLLDIAQRALLMQLAEER